MAPKPSAHRPVASAYCPNKRSSARNHRFLAIVLSSAALAGTTAACTGGKEESSAAYTVGTELGISKAAMDSSARPGDDF